MIWCINSYFTLWCEGRRHTNIRDCCEAAVKLNSPVAVVFTTGKVHYVESLEGKYPWTSPWSELTAVYFEKLNSKTRYHF